MKQSSGLLPAVCSSQLKHSRLGKMAIFHHGRPISVSNIKQTPQKFPYQPLRIGHFWANGSKFSNSVENTWKYIKFATFYVRTGKNQNFEAGPPPIALSMGIPYIAKTELNFPRQTVFWGTGQSDRAKNGQIPSSQWYLGDSVSFFWFFDFGYFYGHVKPIFRALGSNFGLDMA